MDNLPKKRRLTVGLLVGDMMDAETRILINGIINTVKQENLNNVNIGNYSEPLSKDGHRFAHNSTTNRIKTGKAVLDCCGNI